MINIIGNRPLWLKLVLPCLFASLLFFSCTNKKEEQAPDVETYYTCPMDPQVHEDHPGDCPICGMPLVLKTDSLPHEHASMVNHIDENGDGKTAGLATIHPEMKTVQQKITANGIITYDTKQEKDIAARYSGRIEKLYVKYMYQPVKAGDLLLEIYSPEIVTEQQNLIFLLSSEPNDVALIEASKKKLLLLGMSEDQLAEVVKTKKPFYSLPVYSTDEGHVHESYTGNNSGGEMNASNMTALSLKEGMYVTKGQTLFNLLNPHMVWAVFNFYADEAMSIKLHQQVKIVVEGTEKILHGEIDFINPGYSDDSKTLSARVSLDNETHALKVGTFLKGEIETAAITGLWIPKSALLSLGKEDIVWLKDDSGFTAHAIKKGAAHENEIQVLSGLIETDEIALNAHYMTDSESIITTK